MSSGAMQQLGFSLLPEAKGKEEKDTRDEESDS
jgi:hypothetical protein